MTLTIARPREKKEQGANGQPPYNVVLLGNAHSFEYVIRMREALFGHPPEERGYRMVGEVHTTGRAVP